MNKYLIMALMLLFLCGSALASNVAGEKLNGEKNEYVVPFRQEAHAIIVSVYINGSPKEYNFIFDTGARTIINIAVADELGIEKGQRMPTWDPEIKAYSGVADRISVGEAGVGDMKLIIFDFLKYAGFYGLDGLIGSDFMSHFQTTIDYHNQQLIFSHDSTRIPDDSISYRMNFILNPMMGTPITMCSLGGLVDEYGMIDTGSPFGIIIPLTMLDQLKDTLNLELIESVGEIAKWPMSKTSQNYLSRLESFKMGDFELHNVPVVFADIFSILIGEEILSKFTITLDYPNGELILTPNEDACFDAEIYSTGLKIKDEEDGKHYVRGFWKGSPADLAGLEPGDEILEMDSKPIEEYTKSEREAILHDPEVDSLQFVIKNSEGKVRTVTVGKAFLLPPIK
jgi:hypothetical protein